MPQPLTDAINALTTYANSVTGASDTTLSDAVATLASGYGGGGGYTLDDIAAHNYSGDIVFTGTGFNVYASNSAITSFWGANCTNVVGNAFTTCTSLKSVYIGGSNATIGTYAVRYCSALKALRIPKAKANGGLGGYALQGCSSLELIDYGDMSTIQAPSLPTCPFHTIIIRKTTVANLQSATQLDNSTAFQNGGTGGVVYVPAALKDTYPTSGNWATYYGYGTMTFLALEGSPYEQPDFVYQI